MRWNWARTSRTIWGARGRLGLISVSNSGRATCRNVMSRCSCRSRTLSSLITSKILGSMTFRSIPGSTQPPLPSNMARKEQEDALVRAGLEEHRLQKRLRIINITKLRPEYQSVVELNAGLQYTLPADGQHPPETPKPSGQPKREWEKEMAIWKRDLRSWSQWCRENRVPDQSFCISS